MAPRARSKTLLNASTWAILLIGSLVAIAPPAAAAATTSWTDNLYNRSQQGSASSTGSETSCSHPEGPVPPELRVYRPDNTVYADVTHPGTVSNIAFTQEGTWTAKVIKFSGPNCVQEGTATGSTSTTCVDLTDPIGGLSWNPAPAYDNFPNDIARWWSGSVTFTFSGTDGGPSCASHTVTVKSCSNAGNHNNRPGTPGGCTWTTSTSMTLSSGTNTVFHRYEDPAGNWAEYLIWANFDTSNPTVTIPTQASSCSNAGTNGWCKSTMTVTPSVSDATPSSGIASNNCGTYTTPQGTNTYSCSATDRVGRQGSDSEQFKVDSVRPRAPSISLPSCAQGGGWCSTSPQSVSVSWDGKDVTGGTDTSGQGSIKYSKNGGAEQTYSSAVSFTDGQGTIRAWVVDAAGNVGDSLGPLSVNVDSSAPPTPTVSVPSGCTGSNWCTSAWVTFSGSDPHSPTTNACTVAGGGVSCSGTTVGWDGQHTAQITTTNAAGLSSSGSAGVNIDTIAPTATATISCSSGFQADYWCKNGVSISGTGNDGSGSGMASGYPKCTDNSGNVNCSGATSSAQGAHTFNVEARDKAGNSDTDQKTFGVDTVVPSMSVTGPTANSWHNSGFSVTFTASDATSGLSGCEYRVGSSGFQALGCGDGSFWADVESYCTSEGSGACTVEVKGYDNAGNVGSATRAFGIDYTAPTTSLSQTPAASPSGWYKSNVDFTFTCTDNAGGSGCTAQSSLDGGAWTNGGTRTVSTSGLHTLRYRAFDVAGNVEQEHEVTVNIDKVVPTTAITSPAAGSTQPSTFQVSFQDADTGGSGLDVCSYRVTGLMAGVAMPDSGWQTRFCNGSVVITSGLLETTGCRVLVAVPNVAQCKIESQVTDVAGNASAIATRIVSVQ